MNTIVLIQVQCYCRLKNVCSYKIVTWNKHTSGVPVVVLFYQTKIKKNTHSRFSLWTTQMSTCTYGTSETFQLDKTKCVCTYKCNYKLQRRMIAYANEWNGSGANCCRTIALHRGPHWSAGMTLSLGLRVPATTYFASYKVKRIVQNYVPLVHCHRLELSYSHRLKSALKRWGPYAYP